MNPDQSSGSLALRVSPQGRLHLDADAEAAPLDAATGERIRAQFARSAGHGLLHLGAVEEATSLPPSLAYFRDLSRLFLTALCRIPDLDQARPPVQVPCPSEELAALVAEAPPMVGAEYLDEALLASLWCALAAALSDQVAAFDGGVQAWLRAKSPAWNVVGRVCFHLAENRSDEERPFAFLATYSTRLSSEGKPKHVPLGQALKEYAGARNRPALLSLLSPVDKAAAHSALLKELLDSGELYHPLAWSPREAYRFLQEIPALEAAGVVVRVPDWWRARRPPRLAVGVTVGDGAPSGLGLDALLDFSVAITLDGESLSESEWREILAGSDGLALIRGRWVELDRAKLAEVLSHWKKIQKSAERDGLSFLDGMRLLAGAAIGSDGGEGDPEAHAAWSRVAAGGWLASVLEGLRGPEGLAAADPGEALQATLRPYQKVGVSWLWFLHRLGLGACLADDMGLGKTLQVLGLLVLLRREKASGAHLLVVPASLIGNWQSEIERFSPSLRVLVAHSSAMPPAELRELPAKRLADVDLVITSYGSVHRLPWIAATRWRVVILDEAHAIKNSATRQARAVKALVARGRVALTGTPVENRLSDLWSLFDFLNPGLLGSAREFTSFAKRLTDGESHRYGPLRNLVRPYILRRLKSDKSVIADLPDKTELKAYCNLSKRQAALYQQAVGELQQRITAVDGIKRRGVILSFLLRFKQICNHPSQWLDDGAWAPADSGKFDRARELCEAIAAKQERLLVFTQFREMTAPLATFLATVFGRPGMVLHGGTPVGERKRLVDRFQSDEEVPFFVLSVKAGGTGLNLTAASHVLHFDRWWNPAVEDQATDRAYRIGQRRNVLVHKFVCRGTVEEKIDALITGKQGMSRELLSGGGEALLTEMDDRALIELVSLDIRRALDEG